MIRQNEIDLALTADELARWDDTLATLESLVAAFPQLAPAEKLRYLRPPDDSDTWMHDMLVRADQNLKYLPRMFDPAEVRRDLDLVKVLQPRQLRLARVLERVDAARFLARSDAFSELLSARRMLKEADLPGIDDHLNDGLLRFFNRSSPPAAASEPPPIPPAGASPA